MEFEKSTECLEKTEGEKTINTKDDGAGLGERHVQALLMFLGLLLAFAMRVNMSVAVVAMTDSSSESYFSWSMQTQSVILSSFFWGYVILQIPGGMLASRYGAKRLFVTGLAANGVASLALPTVAAYGGWQGVCACRVVQGLAQGVLYPSTHTLTAHWVPPREKGRLGTLILAGAQLGTALQLMASGWLASLWGWSSIFFVDGALVAIWVVAYLVFGADSPHKSKRISPAERQYILASLNQESGPVKKPPTPWKSIVTSLPFYSLIIAHCGQNWGFWTLMTEMPLYMSSVLQVDIKASGVLSALPYLAIWMLSFPLGQLVDFVLRRKLLSVTAARKLSNTIGMWGPAVALLGLTYVPAGHLVLAVALLTVIVGLNAGHYTGFMLVHIDLAPNFAGVLMGITNCIANIISIIAPLVAGAIVKDETNAGEWRIVFIVSSIIYFVGNGFFLLFGTCETQPWNEPGNHSTGKLESSTSNQKDEKVV